MMGYAVRHERDRDGRACKRESEEGKRKKTEREKEENLRGISVAANESRLFLLLRLTSRCRCENLRVLAVTESSIDHSLFLHLRYSEELFLNGISRA